MDSNGKLYRTAAYGGIGSTTATYEQDGYGVLYEYDLTFDTYRVVHYFNYTAPSDVAINSISSLIEPIPGKLYGGTRAGYFFVYDIAQKQSHPLTIPIHLKQWEVFTVI